jgi:hypothetical protein
MIRLTTAIVIAMAVFTAVAFAADDDGSAVYAALQSQPGESSAQAAGAESSLDALQSRVFARESAMDMLDADTPDWLQVGGSVTYRVQSYSGPYSGTSQSVLFGLSIRQQLTPNIGLQLEIGNNSRRFNAIGGRDDDLQIKRAFLHITD